MTPSVKHCIRNVSVPVQEARTILLAADGVFTNRYENAKHPDDSGGTLYGFRRTFNSKPG
jgi:hypothetical protein